MKVEGLPGFAKVGAPSSIHYVRASLGLSFVGGTNFLVFLPPYVFVASTRALHMPAGSEHQACVLW